MAFIGTRNQNSPGLASFLRTWCGTHASKRVVLIAQDESDIPFDLRQWRCIIYGSDKQALTEALMISLQGVHWR